MEQARQWVDNVARRRASSHSERRHDKREQLLQAAVRAVAEHGGAASTGQIAEAAGVPRPHVYRHFESREGLLDAVASVAADELVASLRPSLSGSGTAPELIRAPVEQTVAWAIANPNLYRFLATRRQHEGRRRTGFLGEVLSALRGYLGAGGVQLDLPDCVLAGLMALTDASIVWWLEERDESAEALVERIARHVWVVIADYAASQGTSISADEVFARE